MSDQPPDEMDQLIEAHEKVEIAVPRWVLNTLIASAEAVADAEEVADDIRSDCESAAKIAQDQLDDDS